MLKLFPLGKQTRCVRLTLVPGLLAGLLLSVIELSARAPVRDQPTGVNTNRRTTIDRALNLQTPLESNRAQAYNAYYRSPVSFEVNRGQVDSSVKFLARGNGYTLFLTPQEAVLTLADASVGLNRERTDHQRVMRMKMVGANPAPAMSGVDRLPGSVNYLQTNDSQGWRTGIPTYSKVKYEAVYPGIDVLYYGNQAKLEYDFIVAAGADPDAIRLTFGGATALRLDASGDLLVGVGGSDVKLRRPVAFQNSNDSKVEVAASYDIGADRIVSLELGEYDRTQPLIIDPVLVYSTYLGGSNNDEALAIAVDNAGSAYVTGSTTSMNFPTTPGAFDTTPGPFQAFVTKLDPSGSFPVYSTYLGGGGGTGHGIAVDAAGNAYVTGSAGSGFPTTSGAFDESHNGSSDAFIAKLNSTGSALIYSTYIGGQDIDQAWAIAVNSAGSAFITGLTISNNYPTTPGAFQTILKGGEVGPCTFGDAFVTKLNATGTALEYSTFLGGTDGEFGFGIAVDQAGNAYVGGVTGSTIDYPVTAGAFQTIHGGCLFNNCFSNACSDGFVTKVNPTGTALVYSSYIGGIIGDDVSAIAVDSAGGAVVVGRTSSPNFPLVNALQPVFGGFRDAFVARVNAAGSGLVFSTFLGGTGDEDGLGVAIDLSGNAYVTGHTSGTGFSTSGSLQPFGGQEDAYLTKIDSTGTILIYSTFLGGSGFENVIAGAVAVDSTGAAYVTGITRSPDFPTTPLAFQTIAPGVDSDHPDGFVAKISETPPFDLCIQNDGGRGFLRINSLSGEYSFTSCDGLTLTGTGTIRKKGCTISLQDNRIDRMLVFTMDKCTRKATGSVRILPSGRVLSIVDRDTSNNSCACPNG